VNIEFLIYVIVTLSVIGVIAAIILYFIAEKFKVIEDPRIDQIAELLPAANCGGCGYAGCRNFAETIVKNESLDNVFCPVGGNDLLKLIGPVIGKVAEEKDPMIAVLRCNGSLANAPAKLKYDGLQSCAFMHQLYSGDNGCPYGCLGCGDCVAACRFDAIHLDPITKLPVVDEEKCVACGACAKSCPRNIIEMRNKGKGGKRVFVSCMNKEKGALAKKNCAVACIGCGKCAKVCPFEAITITNDLAYIDFEKCKLCKKCVPECPTNAIHAVNFPAPKTEANVVVTKEE